MPEKMLFVALLSASMFSQAGGYVVQHYLVEAPKNFVNKQSIRLSKLLRQIACYNAIMRGTISNDLQLDVDLENLAQLDINAAQPRTWPFLRILTLGLLVEYMGNCNK